MTNLNGSLAKVIYGGLGIAAGVIGPGSGVAYRVYRRNSSATGSIVSLTCLKIKQFNCYRKRTTLKSLIENTTFDLLVFEAKCDGTKLQSGDILQEIGPHAQVGAFYCVAHVRYQLPFRVVLIRVETPSSLERLHPGAGAANQQPSSGWAYTPVNDAYGGTDVASRYHLMLDNGMYQMMPLGAGTLASIPIGLQPLNRVKDGNTLGLPTPFARTSYLAYIPETYAYQVAELDIIKASMSDTYEIKQVYTSGEIGLSGTICIVEKTQT